MEHKISNELPPVPEQQVAAQSPEMQQAITHEINSDTQQSQAVEAGISRAQPSPQQSTPAQATAQPVTASNLTDLQNPIIADDTDLIEKEWVLKAKEIVARTKNDPHQQNKEVELMKADYMKKRYNKDIKITED